MRWDAPCLSHFFALFAPLRFNRLQELKVAYQRIVLVGLSGSGKSTVARRLAELRRWRAIDTDPELERRAGKPIPRIFAEDGEPAFRALESTFLADACREDYAVIATGGGVPTVETNWPVMRREALVVHL